MNKATIRYETVENPLKEKQGYKGKILHSRSLKTNDLIEEIVSSNTTITRQDALAVISLYEELIKKHLHSGHSISTGIFRASLSLKGNFSHAGACFDNKIHHPHLIIQPAKGLNKTITENLTFHKNNTPIVNQYIKEVFNYSYGKVKKSPDKSFIITRGCAFDLLGNKLKVYGYDAEYQIQLSREAKEPVLLDLIEVSPRKATAYLPGSVEPGNYTLSYNVFYVNKVKDYGSLAVTVEE